MSGNIWIRQLLKEGHFGARGTALTVSERESASKIRETRKLIGSMYHLNSGVCI